MDNFAHYKVLGISDVNCTEQEIRKAYYTLARKHHPDRGGDPEKFKQVQVAYDTLTSKKNKNNKQNPITSKTQHDYKRKGASINFSISVPLHQFYSGATRKLRINRNIPCSECGGKGATDLQQCIPCRGKGFATVDRKLAIGMIQRMHVHCKACKGKGYRIPVGSKCSACNAGLVLENNIVVVRIEKGMKHDDRIVLQNEGDHYPMAANMSPSDVIVILSEEKHHFFERSANGAHLYIHRDITLLEALVGFTFRFEHIDKERGWITVRSKHSVIYKPGDIAVLQEEGMPLRNMCTTYGHIYIKLNIVFPESLIDEHKLILQGVLGSEGKSEEASNHSDVENMIMENMNVAIENQRFNKLISEHDNNKDYYDEDTPSNTEMFDQRQCRTQ